ncbi:MAG: fibronectin type III domain-containing protein [Anaerolineae bacterium]|nr:fibronectin type III domain-containing protein [Anaerolineae bacterium]
MSIDHPKQLGFFNRRAILVLILCVVGCVLLIVDVPAVVLSWDTASEVGTAGFNVYRSPSWDSAAPEDWTKVNDELIPSAGDEMVGADYRFEDDDLTPGRKYRYRIEEVAWDGGATWYPDEVVVRAGFPSRWTKLEGVGLILLGLVMLWHRRGQLE